MLTALAFGAACVPWRCWPRPVAGRRPDRPLSLGRLGMWFAAGAGVCVRSARARTLTRGEAESWRERRGLVGQELEGWPCSSAASRQSGHPKVSNRELQKVLDQIRSTPKQDVSSKPLLARARGLLRAALIRENAMFADEALGVLGRLQHHRGLQLSEEELYRFAEPLVKRSLRWRCPSDEEAAEELIRQRGDLNLPEDQVFEKSLSLLATQLIPAWLEDAQNARADRLKMASESWESLGVEDLEGAVLHVSVSLELGDRRALRRSLEVILSQTTDLRLVLQPAFLADLEARGLVSLDTRNSSNHWCQHVQRAASLACLGEKAGVLLRRHGALLLSEGQVIAEGFNHCAPPLRPRGLDPQLGRHRTFDSPEEARTVAKLSWKRSRPRPAQRHAEVHCLLQVPQLESLKSSHTEILIVELADVGPGFAWAEPCSRGCMQLLMKHGVRQGWWTDGKGGLVTRPFRHEPGLDVAAATFEGSGRLSNDPISERSCLDMAWKQLRETEGCRPWTQEELVQQGAEAVAEQQRQAPLKLRGRVFPLPPRKRSTEYAQAVNELHDTSPTKVKNYGIWLRYDSRTNTHNMYKEYRNININGAVGQLYQEMFQDL
ncbi:unnamed protein product [Durusdinium trenchii]|uniref:Large ribosomal subunit protein eL20 domain-containing protein n=1 Tax=Durusdinium trenchii TaxID=1381693 RepID=A0ABP0KS44_9DINO